MVQPGIALDSLNIETLRKVATEKWHKGQITNRFSAAQLRRVLDADILPDIPPSTLTLPADSRAVAINHILRAALQAQAEAEADGDTPPDEEETEAEADAEEAEPEGETEADAEEAEPEGETEADAAAPTVETPADPDGLTPVGVIAASLVQAERTLHGARIDRAAAAHRLKAITEEQTELRNALKHLDRQVETQDKERQGLLTRLRESVAGG
jgi:hypothetical protein